MMPNHALELTATSRFAEIGLDFRMRPFHFRLALPVAVAQL